MTNIEIAEKNIEIILGRLNGIHALLLTLARELPPDVAARCMKEAQVSFPKLDADLNASPLSEATISEMQRVIEQGISVFQSAANEER